MWISTRSQADDSKFVFNKDFAHLFFSFEGLSKRIHYWSGLLVVAVINAILGKLASSYQPTPPLSTAERVGGIITLIIVVPIGLILQWSLLAITVKRWHDRNRSGWWVLAGMGSLFVPLVFFAMSDSRAIPETIFDFVMFIVVLFWMWILVQLGFLRGTNGPNRYGSHW